MRGQGRRGFTLIEIIAVLVILGVLASVAIPKYLDMQDLATEKALADGVAAGFSACSLTYAKGLLSGATFTCSQAQNNISTMGDVVVTIGPASQTATCVITVTRGSSSTSHLWNTPTW